MSSLSVQSHASGTGNFLVAQFIALENEERTPWVVLAPVPSQPFGAPASLLVAGVMLFGSTSFPGCSEASFLTVKIFEATGSLFGPPTPIDSESKLS
jgi:hypothetical protein